MTEESKTAFLAYKSAKVIKSLSDLAGLTIQEATDIYYQSDTSELIEQGVADLQCRSDKYLATVIWDEHLESLQSVQRNEKEEPLSEEGGGFGAEGFFD